MMLCQNFEKSWSRSQGFRFPSSCVSYSTRTACRVIAGFTSGGVCTESRYVWPGTGPKEIIIPSGAVPSRISSFLRPGYRNSHLRNRRWLDWPRTVWSHSSALANNHYHDCTATVLRYVFVSSNTSRMGLIDLLENSNYQESTNH